MFSSIGNSICYPVSLRSTSNHSYHFVLPRNIRSQINNSSQMFLVLLHSFHELSFSSSSSWSESPQSLIPTGDPFISVIKFMVRKINKVPDSPVKSVWTQFQKSPSRPAWRKLTFFVPCFLFFSVLFVFSYFLGQGVLGNSTPPPSLFETLFTCW